MPLTNVTHFASIFICKKNIIFNDRFQVERRDCVVSTSMKEMSVRLYELTTFKSFEFSCWCLRQYDSIRIYIKSGAQRNERMTFKMIRFRNCFWRFDRIKRQNEVKVKWSARSTTRGNNNVSLYRSCTPTRNFETC